MELITEIILLIKLLIILNLLIMALLTRELLLKPENFKKEKVEIKDTDGALTGDFVYVRQMSAKENDEFQHSLLIVTKGEDGKIKTEQDTTNFQAKLAVATVCDESGKVILEQKHIPVLVTSMTAHTLGQIADAASKLNGFDNAKKEEVLKN